MASTEKSAAVGRSHADTLADRIRARLRVLDISEREASRRVGFPPGYVGDVLSGRSKEPALPRMIKLASALECDVEYLIAHQATARSINEDRSFATGLRNQASAQRLIDLYSAPSISDDLWVTMSERPVDKVPVIPPLHHVDGAYAWSICTRHMEPRYYIGEVVYLHPGISPRIGDFVFVRMRDGRVGVSRMVEWGDGQATFEYVNGGQRCTVAQGDIDYIHRIVGTAS